jgi:hypothetical protein
MKSLFFGLLCWLACAPALAAVSTLPAPVVVVYPITVNGNADPESGGRLALLFATRLAEAGGITVKPATPGVQRTLFLQAAQSQGADYYVTGYLTPLGDSVSLVDQVVSTYSGIVVWSNSTEIKTYGEASGQADLMRDAILRHAGRTMAALDHPAPAPTSTPAPSASSNPNEANLTHLFSRKPKATPAPPPAAATHPPAPPPPPLPAGQTAASGAVAAAENHAAIVVAIGGQASDAELRYAATALSQAIAKAGLGGTLVASRTTSDLPAHAKELCVENRAAAIYGGTLSLQRVNGAFSHAASANFELIRYDCGGVVTAREQAQTQASGKSGTNVAIDRAVAKSLEAALRTPPTKRT